MKSCFFQLFLLLGFIGYTAKAQTTIITGQVSGNDDIENIHVINITSKTFTTTNSKGVFNISVKLKDTLLFSAIQYSTKEIIIGPTAFNSKSLQVHMDEHVNALDEVIVGKILTGDLLSDVKNVEGEPDINFYDVGIKGYMGKPKTQSERRLFEATTGGGIVPLNPILNAITGRTKMLKQHIAMERNDELITKIRQQLSEDFFSEHPLEESRRMDFFYFCSDDPNFMKYCKGKSDIEILVFLNRKYVAYLQNLKSH